MALSLFLPTQKSRRLTGVLPFAVRTFLSEIIRNDDRLIELQKYVNYCCLLPAFMQQRVYTYLQAFVSILLKNNFPLTC